MVRHPNNGLPLSIILQYVSKIVHMLRIFFWKNRHNRLSGQFDRLKLDGKGRFYRSPSKFTYIIYSKMCKMMCITLCKTAIV